MSKTVAHGIHVRKGKLLTIRKSHEKKHGNFELGMLHRLDVTKCDEMMSRKCLANVLGLVGPDHEMVTKVLIAPIFGQYTPMNVNTLGSVHVES